MLFTKLMECGISSKMLNMIIALYNNVTSCVKLKNSITDEFPSEVGLRQGDCLSPILFSLYINPFATEFFGFVVRNYFWCQF